MKSLMFCACILLAQSVVADDSFKPLFDGKTFTGWEGNQSVFRIEDGPSSAATSRQMWHATNTFVRRRATATSSCG